MKDIYSLKEYNLEKDNNLVLVGNSHVDSGFKLMKQIMELSVPRKTAGLRVFLSLLVRMVSQYPQVQLFCSVLR